jgi:hypothetical protein
MRRAAGSLCRSAKWMGRGRALVLRGAERVHASHVVQGGAEVAGVAVVVVGTAAELVVQPNVARRALWLEGLGALLVVRPQVRWRVALARGGALWLEESQGR